jgi:GMP synthase (glutamine-hydrolysing)
VILSGGPASVFAEGAPLPPREVFDLSVPVLGICYGQQAMMHMLGGQGGVGPRHRRVRPAPS